MSASKRSNTESMHILLYIGNPAHGLNVSHGTKMDFDCNLNNNQKVLCYLKHAVAQW